MPATTDIPPDAVKLARELAVRLRVDEEFITRFLRLRARHYEIDVDGAEKTHGRFVQLILSVWPSEGQSS